MIAIGNIMEVYFTNMSCTIPTLPIDIQDCVGDSLGKHNYNTLVLDTTVCNLSSLLYSDIINVSNIFKGLSSIIVSYDSLIKKYNETKVNKITLASSTVNLLSSFWDNYEFSVLYPLNALSLSNENLTILAPILSNVNIDSVSRMAESTLKNFANSYLQEKFDISNFQENAQVSINVTFFVYNVMPNLADTTVNDTLTRITYSPESFFDYNRRLLTYNFKRDNTHFTTGVILKFYLQNNRWNYAGYVIDNNITKNNVIIDTPVILPDTVTDRVTPAITSSVSTSITPVATTISPNAIDFTKCTTLKPNKYYLLSNYSYIRTKATAAKKAKIVMTFMNSKNSISTLNYTANGYNKKTNTGGTDLYMEYDSVLNTVTAYEEHPTEKKVVQTWNAPFTNQEGVNFKFNFTSKTRNICGIPK
jgi:hypothetical protein